MDVEQRIDEYAKQELETLRDARGEEVEQDDEVAVETPERVDIYQQDVNKRTEKLSKSVHRGTSTLTREIAKEELERLAKFKKRAEADVAYWENYGDKERAKMVKDQYIEDHFLPAVEVTIVSSTPDEVLNAKDILSEFDKLSLQYGPGYTAAYIRTAYGDQLGSSVSHSDGYVKNMIDRIKALAASYQNRAAYGIAKKVKEEIDNGEHIADEGDYEIIARVASIG